MNLLLISSSPHKETSRTFLLAKEMLKGFEKAARVEIIHLCDWKIEFCKHCEYCHRINLACPIKDDAGSILKKMLAADGIIFATPNYINQVTASLKALFDRSSHFIHCKRLLDSRVCGVVTSGSGSGDDKVLDYLKYYAQVCGAQYCGGVSSGVPVPESKTREAFLLGEKLFRDVREKTVYPDQLDAIQQSKLHFKKIIQMRKNEWPGEYEYWKTKGWL